MYVPEHFAELRPEQLHGLIEANPLGALVTAGAGGLDANHLPFELDPSVGPHGRLTAHVARANPLWQEVVEGDDVLVIFRAADGYVSPNWYPSKQESHRHVPTWNYQVVHAHGRIRVMDDERFVRAVVGRLTRTHEGRLAQAHPWKMSDAEKDYLGQMLKAIVGIEVDITRLQGKWKLSQNREERDRLGVIDALRARGDQRLADAVLDASRPK